MDDLYLQQLPADLQALVQDIEGLSGFIIQVEVDAARRGTLASYVDEHRATLLLPREDFFPPPSVFHELLHLRRFLVDGVPQIVANDDYQEWTPEGPRSWMAR